MKRLTIKDSKGNGSMCGIPWEKIPREIYGALCKLKDYEDTDCTPDDVERLNEFEGSNAEKYLMEIAKHRWRPVEESLPEDDRFILLSFANFSIPMVGRYEADDSGGEFYLGDEDESCVKQDMYVNAWMPLPEPYRG